MSFANDSEKLFEIVMEKILNVEQENERLTAQIEKMKCCENCKHSYHDNKHTLQCRRDCLNFNNWELAE